MADKKLNAVSTASDGAYIYAEDASGNQIKISKADLASVVAGLLGAPTMWNVRVPSSSPIKTPITINSIAGPFAYLYIISFNWGDKDATYYEYGIIRRGYSENNISKEVISQRSRADISFSFSYSDDGYITIVASSSSSYPSLNVRLLG